VIFCCDVSSDAEIHHAGTAVSEAHGGRCDAVVHSIAFAPSHGMKSPLLECTREDYRIAHDISAYSFIAVARVFSPLIEATGGGSLCALTFVGSGRVVPSYRVMGPAKASLESIVKYLAVELVRRCVYRISTPKRKQVPFGVQGPKKIRVNALSPGPLETLAARGITGFTVSGAIIVVVARRSPCTPCALQDLHASAREKAPLHTTLSIQDVGRVSTFLASSASACVTGQCLMVDCGSSVLM
jgi:enoyl-[acyl-carrier protein] reductase I